MDEGWRKRNEARHERHNSFQIIKIQKFGSGIKDKNKWPIAFVAANKTAKQEGRRSGVWRECDKQLVGGLERITGSVKLCK